MTSFLIRTDEHVTHRPPASRADDYFQTCLDKLAQIGSLAEGYGVDAVLDNGDFFHRYGTPNNPHWMMKSLMDLHDRAYPCPVFVNPGNHDFPHGRVELVKKQPLGVMFASGAFERMTDHRWTDKGVETRVVGLPYDPNRELLDYDIDRDGEDVLVVASHDSATPEGKDLFGGTESTWSYRDLSDCTPDVFIFGHLHADRGIERVGGSVFYNLGSMTRGALTRDNLERTPRVGYLEIVPSSEAKDGWTLSTEAVELDVEPGEDVFDMGEHQEAEADREHIDAFVEQLETSADPDEQDLEDEIRSWSDFREEVREKALHYLRQCG